MQRRIQHQATGHQTSYLKQSRKILRGQTKLQYRTSAGKASQIAPVRYAAGVMCQTSSAEQARAQTEKRDYFHRRHGSGSRQERAAKQTETYLIKG